MQTWPFSATRIRYSGWSIGKCHRKAINELFGAHVVNPFLDSSFRLLLPQLDVDGFEARCSSGRQPSLAWLWPSTPLCVTARPCGARLLKTPSTHHIIASFRPRLHCPGESPHQHDGHGDSPELPYHRRRRPPLPGKLTSLHLDGRHGIRGPYAIS